MVFSTYSVSVTLLLVMDPLGNIPVFISTLKNYPPAKQRWIILRETMIAFVFLALFLFCGHAIMRSLNLELPALSIAGGLVLFLIAIKMLFPVNEPESQTDDCEEPFIVPLAIPLTAGPSALATVMLFSSRYPDHMMSLLLALAIVSVIFLCCVLSGGVLMRIFGRSGLIAMERLMGLILITISVQMFLHGLVQFLNANGGGSF